MGDAPGACGGRLRRDAGSHLVATWCSGSRRGRWNRAGCAVAAVRSYSRPPTYGPRSITGTRTTRPWWRSVTFVPHGSDLWATPSCAGVERAAAAERVAVQAGPVPRRVARCGTRSGGRACACRPGRRADAHARAGAQRAGACDRAARSGPRASVRSRSSVTQRPPRLDLQRDGRAGGLDAAA